MSARFSNAGVATKISAAVGVGVVALVVVGGVAVTRLGSVRDTADTMYTEGLARKSALDDATARMFEVRAYVNRIVIDNTPADVAKREQQIADTDKAPSAGRCTPRSCCRWPARTTTTAPRPSWTAI